MAENTVEEKKETKELSPKLEEIMKSIEVLTALELSDLVKGLEDKFDIQAAAPMMAGAMTCTLSPMNESSTLRAHRSTCKRRAGEKARLMSSKTPTIAVPTGSFAFCASVM